VTNCPMKRVYHSHMVLSPRFTRLFFQKAITSAYGVHFEGIVFSDCVKFHKVFCWSSYLIYFCCFKGEILSRSFSWKISTLTSYIVPDLYKLIENNMHVKNN
jgi:hypothetical protein